MLKIIVTVREDTEAIRVHLYGQLTGEYIPEVEKTLSGQGADAYTFTLDLSNVTFVDRAGMKFLCGAKPRNIAVENIPPYVRRWMEQEDRCGPA